MRYLFLLIFAMTGAVNGSADVPSGSKDTLEGRRQARPTQVRASLLLKAIKEGNVEQVRRALHLGFDPNERSRDNETALELAINKASPGGPGVEMLGYLVLDGANIDAPGSTGDPPLIQALKENKVEAVRLLARKGASLTSVDKDGNTPLHVAISKNNLEAFDYLVAGKSGLNVKNSQGNTPLHWALLNDRPGMAMELVTAGADLKALNNDGETPLDEAAQKGYFDVVAVLFLKGASITDHSGKSRNTPLHYAAQVADFDSVVFLMSNGANVNAVNVYGDTPLMMAVANRQTRGELVEYLAKSGAQLDHANADGITALHEAARVGNTAAIEMLLKHGARIDVVDHKGRTALYLAALNGHLEAVKSLVKHQSYINTQPSPLKAAIDNQHESVVHFLIENGARL